MSRRPSTLGYEHTLVSSFWTLHYTHYMQSVQCHIQIVIVTRTKTQKVIA